jgi:hypothetical protein
MFTRGQCCPSFWFSALFCALCSALLFISLSSSCFLCDNCCQCLWIVHSLWSLRFHLTVLELGGPTKSSILRQLLAICFIWVVATYLAIEYIKTYIYIYYICCSYEMYRVDASNNELPGVLGKSTYIVILTIQTSLVSRHTVILTIQTPLVSRHTE